MYIIVVIYIIVYNKMYTITDNMRDTTSIFVEYHKNILTSIDVVQIAQFIYKGEFVFEIFQINELLIIYTADHNIFSFPYDLTIRKLISICFPYLYIPPFSYYSSYALEYTILDYYHDYGPSIIDINKIIMH